MNRSAEAGIAVFSWTLSFLASAARADSRGAAAGPAGAARAELASAYGSVPLAFQENLGQADPRVRFTARGLGVDTFLTGSELVVALPGGGSESPQTPRRGFAPLGQPRARHESAVVRIRVVGAAASARPVGLEALPGIANYFIGNDPSKWRTGVRTYSRVMFQEVYPGVDLIFHGKQRRLEYDFAVAPGADAGSIRLAFEGVDALRVNERGDLLLTVGGRELVQRRPVAYEDGGGRAAALGDRRKVDAFYAVSGEREVAIRVTGRDSARALVVDPVLEYSTYLGGSSNEEITGMAVDRWGNAVVAGWTTSTDFPLAHRELASAARR